MEKPHPRIIADFELVISVLDRLGADYRPTNPLIYVSALDNRLEEARAVIEELDAAFIERASKTAAIDAALGQLGDFALVFQKLVSGELRDPQLLNDLEGLIRQISSRLREAFMTERMMNPGFREPFTGRTEEQRQRDRSLNCLADLIEILKHKCRDSLPEAENTIAALEKRLVELNAKNDAAKSADAAVRSAQAARDALINDPERGIPKLLRQIRLELARWPGRQSAAYLLINSLDPGRT